jgi:hypothetical protein
MLQLHDGGSHGLNIIGHRNRIVEVFQLLFGGQYHGFSFCRNECTLNIFSPENSKIKTQSTKSKTHLDFVF